MKDHNKITFTKEYCLCRRIPHKFHNETLIIGEKPTYKTIYSVYNFTYADLIAEVDKLCEYDAVTTYFVGMK